jgi:hypothetical protein
MWGGSCSEIMKEYTHRTPNKYGIIKERKENKQ